MCTALEAGTVRVVHRHGSRVEQREAASCLRSAR